MKGLFPWLRELFFGPPMRCIALFEVKDRNEYGNYYLSRTKCRSLRVFYCISGHCKYHCETLCKCSTPLLPEGASAIRKAA